MITNECSSPNAVEFRSVSSEVHLAPGTAESIPYVSSPSLRAPLLGVCNWAVSVNRMTLQLGDHGRAQVDTGRLVASSLEDKHVP